MDALSDVSKGSDIFSSVPIFPPHPVPLNLDDLFGFSEVARRKLPEEIIEDKYFTTNRIFINHVDSFTGKHIMSLLLGNNLSIERDFGDDDKTPFDSMERSTNANENQNHIHSNVGMSNFLPRADNKLPILRETVDNDKATSLEEKCLQDTSKLTVAEYYDMMELESIESRNAFIKQKLERYHVKSSDANALKYGPEASNKFPDNNLTNNGSYTSKYEIVGTLTNTKLENIEGVTVIKQACFNDPEFLKELLTCGIIIYCVNENLDQTNEAIWVFNSIISFINETKETCLKNHTFIGSPIFVLVSTFMTWALTEPLSTSEDLPFIESDFKNRIPHPNYQLVYELEEQLVKAQLEYNVKSIIIVSGLLYGHEEIELCNLFEEAYCYKNVSLYSHETKFIPLVHVESLAQIVKQTIKHIHHTTTPFVFAKDPFQNTMTDISKAISLSLGTGICELQSKEFSFIDDMVTQELFDKVTSNVYMESCYPVFNEEDILWKYESGFIENINYIVKEFIDSKHIKPLRIIFYNVSLSDKLKNITHKISKHCHIPLINPQHLIVEHFEEVLKKQALIVENNLVNSIEVQNRQSTKSYKSPINLILCEDKKRIEHELELIKKWKINTGTAVEAILSQESDGVNILARKLKMNPYIHQGYLLKEYPQNLEEAHILFSGNIEETFNNNSIANNNQIIPNIVIFYNKQTSSRNLTLDILQGTTDDEEHHSRISILSKHQEDVLIIDNANHSSDVKKEKEKYTADETPIILDTSSKATIRNTMMSFFSNLGETCVVVPIDFSEHESEDDIFYKTLNVIQSCGFICGAQETIAPSIDEDFPRIQESTNMGITMNKNFPSSNSQAVIENNIGDELKEAEEITLAIRSYPLICYLIQFIFPTLTNGILEVSNQTLQDPIDFLAEYIFKNNPQGHMMASSRKEFNGLDEQLRNKKKCFPKIDSKACLA